jgi:hypothetical protein
MPCSPQMPVICAWRLTVPEGHRFKATQALRQVLRTYPSTRNHDRLSSALRGPAEVELRPRRRESEAIAKRARGNRWVFE